MLIHDLKHWAILFVAVMAGSGAVAQTAQVVPSAPRAAELKIGLVNTEKLLRESAPAQRVFKKLEREFATRGADVERISKRFRDMSAAFEKEQLTLPDADRRNKQRELEMLSRDLQRAQRELREDENLRRNEELAGLTEWLKFCDKDKDTGKEFCVTLRNFGRTPEQPDISMALYDIKGDKQKVMRLQLPPGFMLRPGFRYSFDKSAAQSGTYEICFPNGCFAEAKFEAPVLEAMKKAATLFISVQLQNASELQFSVPLAGFGKALEGPAADPKVIEEQQKAAQQKLEEDLKRQAEQLKGQEAPAPAPAAPPKP